jgi:hypothetical protein
LALHIFVYILETASQFPPKIYLGFV